jgi:hypothetical protein
LTHPSTRLHPDWPELLSNAFVREVRDRPSGDFLGLLNQFVQVSLRSGESIENWWRALLALRQLVDLPTTGTEANARAENLWLHAQMQLTETAERYWQYEQALTNKRNQIVHEVGQQLITARDVAGLVEVLADELPKVGIPGCYLAAYQSALPDNAEVTAPSFAPSRDALTARARLLLAYENGERTEIAADSAVFPAMQLVPGGRLHRTRPFSMIAAPLYVNDQQLGFVVFELGPKIGWIYAALHEQLSKAVHIAFMAERERLPTAAIRKAQRRGGQYGTG